MNQRPRVPTLQLGLDLAHQGDDPLAKELREELIRALADLLLEATGATGAAEEKLGGGRDESEDHA